MKRIALLGSTGSIGRQVLDVVRRLPERLSLVALAAHTNVEELFRQAREFGVRHLGIVSCQAVERIQGWLNTQEFFLYEKVEGLCELVRRPEVDFVVVAVSGMIGLQPTLAALQAGKTVALSTKEVLVAGGELVVQEAMRQGVQLLPIDSEHSAIFQCLQGEKRQHVEKIILTASGGPFANRRLEELHSVTVEEALKHPNWNMGEKVTIDSATMMNKGLEVIEAHWLFGLPYDRIQVVLHPQSIVHSLVEFKDGSILAQLGLPDMRLPIQYALLYPDRVESGLPRLSLTQVGTLTFQEPDPARFPCLEMAYYAARCGGTMPAALNAANETAVQLFLKRRIAFPEIAQIIRSVIAEHQPQPVTLENVLSTEAWARQKVLEITSTPLEEVFPC